MFEGRHPFQALEDLLSHIIRLAHQEASDMPGGKVLPDRVRLVLDALRGAEAGLGQVSGGHVLGSPAQLALPAYAYHGDQQGRRGRLGQ